MERQRSHCILLKYVLFVCACVREDLSGTGKASRKRGSDAFNACRAYEALRRSGAPLAQVNAHAHVTLRELGS
jgi:hypothetical protein